MSRSALWRQESNVKERERQATETFLRVVEEGRVKHVKGALPLIGPHDTFNLNPMLIQNISKCPYFLKCCSKISEWTELVDEIYYESKHMEPWATGGFKIPSSTFCLLVRLFTLRCTEKQMTAMLSHPDSPYIRCTGFLYLRYAVEPNLIWKWFEPYLYDDEPVRITSDMKVKESTVGEYARRLLTEMDYYGTLLPRLPVTIEREVKVKMLLAEKNEERALNHMKSVGQKAPPVEMFQEGMRIRALYGDEENPVTWYDAVIDRVIRRDEESGEELSRPKYWVTFPEYGNSECVSLGEVDFISGGIGYEQPHGVRFDNVRDRVSRNLDRCDRYAKDDYRNRDQKIVGKHDAHGSRNHDKRRGYTAEPYDNRKNRDHYREASSSRNWENCSHIESGNDLRKRSRSGSPVVDRERACEDNNFARGVLNQEEHLLEEVKRREREKSAALGKAYARRPATFKRSLVANQHHSSRGGVGRSDKKLRSRSRSTEGRQIHHKTSTNRKSESDTPTLPAERVGPGKTSEELAAIESKKRKLLAKYC